MKILSITTGYTPQTGLVLFGLGDDNKVYRWDANAGDFLPNWNEPDQSIAQQPANRAQRRKSASAKSKSGKKR